MRCPGGLHPVTMFLVLLSTVMTAFVRGDDRASSPLREAVFLGEHAPKTALSDAPKGTGPLDALGPACFGPLRRDGRPAEATLVAELPAQSDVTITAPANPPPVAVPQPPTVVPQPSAPVRVRRSPVEIQSNPVQVRASADLAVTGVALDPSPLAAGQQGRVRATVSNLGRQSISDVVVRFFVGDQQLGQDRHLALGPLTAVVVEQPFASDNPGRYAIIVQVDPDNRIAEADERNNVGGVQIEVRPASPTFQQDAVGGRLPEQLRLRGVDLVVNRFGLTQKPADHGVRVRVAAAVANDSSELVKDVKVQFFLDGKPVGNYAVVDMPASGNAMLAAEILIEGEGEHAVAVVVDPDDRVRERDEENNTKAARVTVQLAGPQMKVPPEGMEADLTHLPQLEVAKVATFHDLKRLLDTAAPDLTCEVQTVNEVHTSSTAYIEVKVSNKGTFPTTKPFTVGFCREGDAQASVNLATWSPTVTWMGKAVETGLLYPGQTRTVKVLWQTQTIGAKLKYVAAVDLDNTIGELSGTENNNISAPFAYQVAPTVVFPTLPPVAGSGPTIVVTQPAEGDVWSKEDTAVPIVKWIKTGSMAPTVRMWYFRPGKAPAIGGPTNEYYQAITLQAANSGSLVLTNWGSPGSGPWKIRVETTDGKVQGDSGVFWVEGGWLSITSPSSGAVLVPLQGRPISWESKGAMPPGGLVDLALIPKKAGVVTSQDSPDTVWIKKGATMQAEVGGGTGAYNWAVPADLLSGDYLIRVEAPTIPQWGASVPVKIASQLSPGTAFLNPGEPEFELVGTLFDGIDIGHLAVRLRCVNGPYSGPLVIGYNLQERYDFDPVTEAPVHGQAPLLKAETTVTVDFAANEVKTVPFLPFSFALDEYYIPKSPPLWGCVYLPGPAGGGQASSHTSFEPIFKTPKADIVTSKALYLSPSGKQDWNFAVKETTLALHESQFTWTAKDSFEGGLRVHLYNWGGTERTFDCTLYVDDLPGQVLDTITLPPGIAQELEKVVTFKINPNAKDDVHQIVFIADQAENNDQPYPNSYMNNFIRMYLKINRGGTITGSP